jgi:hypothetical protein
MELLKLPNKEEIHGAFDQGEEAEAVLFYTNFEKMAERIQQLEDRVAKNGGNSGKPPSNDGMAKKPNLFRTYVTIYLGW